MNLYFLGPIQDNYKNEEEEDDDESCRYSVTLSPLVIEEDIVQL